MSASPPVLTRLQIHLRELFGLGRAAVAGFAVLVLATFVLALVLFMHASPRKMLVLSSGPPGSAFERNAERYAKILKRSGVRLKIVPSEGSLQNLQRLVDPKSKIDIGFVQSGEARGLNVDRLVSLGSLYHQPLLFFYRGRERELLAQFKGARLAIGPQGSGGHALTLGLLAANGIQPGGSTRLETLDAEAAARSLLAGGLDGAFMMGDFASSDLMKQLLKNRELRLFSFAQADAYVRKFTYLDRMESPRGSIDFGMDLPPRDTHLIGPTVELVAKDRLHPALCDLLLEAAREVHGSAGIFKRQGEFPAPVEHEIRLSEDALRYYKSGKSLLYRSLPFWLASLVNRLLAVVLPLIVVLVPGLKLIPAAYRWRFSLRFYRAYRALLGLEQELAAGHANGDRAAMLKRLESIEAQLGRRIPAPFAGQFYDLRGHIELVRQRLSK